MKAGPRPLQPRPWRETSGGAGRDAGGAAGDPIDLVPTLVQGDDDCNDDDSVSVSEVGDKDGGVASCWTDAEGSSTSSVAGPGGVTDTVDSAGPAKGKGGSHAKKKRRC